MIKTFIEKFFSLFKKCLNIRDSDENSEHLDKFIEDNYTFDTYPDISIENLYDDIN